MKQKLWLVGEYKSGQIPNVVWEYWGIFDDKQKAVMACRNENYFVTLVFVGQLIPEETVSFPDMEWPLA